MSMPSDAQGRREYIKTTILPKLDLRPFINGEFHDSYSDDLLDILDPMLNQVVTNMPSCGEKDINNAVVSARAAFEAGPWSNMHPRERAKILYKLADLIDQNKDHLVLIESMDVGKPISGVRGWDISNASEVYRYYAGWADKITGDVLPPVGGYTMQTRPEPVGVCAAIIPWNFPFPCISWKIAPALAVGCTVVIKPSERAPLSAQFLAHLVNEAGFPPGVINVVMGLGDVAGNALVSNPDVDKITFTGSRRTAKNIVRSSAEHLPRLTFELGGKSPNIILEDADLEKAAANTVIGFFDVAGQNCCATSRTFVHEKVYDEFVALVTEKTKERRLGDQLDDSTQQGPQIDGRHFKVISGYVDNALSDGASCLVGGGRAKAGELFFEPTVLSNVNDDMTIAQEEVFGPVGLIFKFSSLDEAIKRSNDTAYGLAAAIWTKDTGKAEYFTRKIKAGACWINCFGMFDTVAPWGGYKQSGYGRELGVQALQSFIETKTVFYLHDGLQNMV